LFQVSLKHPDAFFVRFSDKRWCDLVAVQPLFHFRGVPLVIRRFTILCLTEVFRPRFSVRLFIEGLPEQAWSTSTVKAMLPSCHIFCVAKESDEKSDMSYFVADAWVEHPDLVPREVDFSIHEPWMDVNQLHGLELLTGFISAPGQDDLTEGWLPRRPRLLRKTVLVHLDMTTYVPPFPPTRIRPTRSDSNDDDEPAPDRWRHPWGRGVSDDAWHNASGGYVGSFDNGSSGSVFRRLGDPGSRRHDLADAGGVAAADAQAPPPRQAAWGPKPSVLCPNGQLTDVGNGISTLPMLTDVPLTGASGEEQEPPAAELLPNRGADPPVAPLKETAVHQLVCPLEQVQ
jgi:hypothetical protein